MPPHNRALRFICISSIIGGKTTGFRLLPERRNKPTICHPLESWNPEISRRKESPHFIELIRLYENSVLHIFFCALSGHEGQSDGDVPAVTTGKVNSACGTIRASILFFPRIEAVREKASSIVPAGIMRNSFTSSGHFDPTTMTDLFSITLAITKARCAPAG